MPRALAIVNGGNALATVIAAPLGSFLGGLIGWRGAFFCVVPVAVIRRGVAAVSLPSAQAQRRSEHRQRTAPADSRRDHGHAGGQCLFMGQFMLFTYLRPFLETVTQVSVSLLSLTLLVLGMAGLAGTFLIERFSKRSLYPTLIAIPLLMALIALALVCLRQLDGDDNPVAGALGPWSRPPPPWVGGRGWRTPCPRMPKQGRPDGRDHPVGDCFRRHGGRCGV